MIVDRRNRLSPNGRLTPLSFQVFWGIVKMAFIFEKLTVYQKTLDFAEKISKITEAFSRGSYYLSDQLNRAATSIALNIAEGNGRYHKNDRNNFFYIARGSVHECVPLVELAYRKGLISSDIRKELFEHLETIAKMLSGPYKVIQANPGRCNGSGSL